MFNKFSSRQTFVTSLLFFLLTPVVCLAATLSVSPSTGVYNAGSTFVVRLVVNTEGKPINAAEGTLKFNPQELTVVSVDRSNSIFNLWVTEPTFSNTAGTINFSGGLPSGYTGANGSIFNIVFRTASAATARVSITGGSVLANDGMGTNVLSSMNGGNYTIQAVANVPRPEVVEYVPIANTPGTPIIKSITHAQPDLWYKEKTAELNWEVPSPVTSIRTLLDQVPDSVPTKVYENPISSIKLENLPEGVSYFHLQYRNTDGWGRVVHYRLAIDSQPPTRFIISQVEAVDPSTPNQILSLEVEDETSGVDRYRIKINNEEPYDFQDKEQSKKITLPPLLPGQHFIVIEAFDKAGNSITSNYTLRVEAFTKPVFTEYPSEINEEVIPVIRGLTRANARVKVTVQKIGTEPVIYNLVADEAGVFTLIPSGTFTTGVYELTAVATDVNGAQSESSDQIRIAVQQPGYVQIGSFLINILSVVIPLVAMTVMLVIATWFMITYLRRFRKKVSVESGEAVAIVTKEFSYLQKTIKEKQLFIAEAKRTKKLSRFEEDIFLDIEKTLEASQKRIEKEVSDIEKLVRKKTN